MVSTVQKIALAVVGLAWFATAVSSKNQTSSVLSTTFTGSQGILNTAMGNG